MGISPTELKKLVKDARKTTVTKESGLNAAIKAMNKRYFVAKDGSKVLIFEEETLVGSTFRDIVNHHLNEKYPVDVDKYVSIGDAWINHADRRTYKGLVLDPTKPPRGRTDDDNYNMWRGFKVAPKPGNWDLLKTHIMDNACQGSQEIYDYFIKWMASAVQVPNKPAGVAMVLRGDKGCGKSIICDRFKRIFGPHGIQVTSSKYITGNFNAHLRDKILLFADEAFWAGDKQGESALKGLITEPTITIEGKGKDAISVPNMLHVMMASNAEWVVPASGNERRYCVLDVSDAQMQNQAYFDPITAQMEDGGEAAMLYELLNVNLDGFKIRKFPVTTALSDQKLHSLDDFSQWWQYKLETGELFNWGDWTICEKIYDDYIGSMKNRSVTRRSSECSFGKSLKRHVPMLRKKQMVQHDGGRKNCYLLPSLTECRELFCRELKTEIIWEEIDEEEAPF